MILWDTSYPNDATIHNVSYLIFIA